MRGLLALALLYGLSGLASPALAAPPETVRANAPAAAPSPAAMARDKAQLAFQRDLVSVLAPRVDARPLLAAALLARPLLNPPESLTFHTLIGRAAAAKDAGPAVTWARLADCAPAPGNCPNPAALEQLQEQAADNAAVWLLKLGTDTHALDPDAARQDLAHAAAAKAYDDYTGISLQALAGSIGVLPPPADTLDPAHAAGAVGMQAMLVFGLGGAQVQPALQITAKLCENAGDDAAIKSDCLKLGKLLEWGSSPLARSLGLHLREVLDEDPARQSQAKRARLDLVWQVQSFAALSSRATNDKALAQHLLALARNGGTEMSLLLAALRDDGISTEAPAGWTPGSRK
ncbi:MAG: hypothetical protein ABI300_08605 [Rhodanobacter sp.]